MAAENKVGRPTKYKHEYCELAFNYCLLGATDADLARFFDVSEQTINTWKHEYPEFLESIKKGKVDADALVAKSLFQRAIGYQYIETKNEMSEQGMKKSVTTKEAMPDTTAQIFWLKNRQPDKWRDKPVAVSEELDATPVKIVVNVQDARKQDDKPET
ncbi:DNA-packaging protein [Wohlfahrtiimonas chitiniclastica]|uniref:DNA-packaging protein n=1 Tax=Wohlfahrtiimonas chitiniclastica TaxID=400946 RepID=UPI001FEEC12D|nr:DNA-packaging protein [Wohlfahrtiimonas chitiniclastica]